MRSVRLLSLATAILLFGSGSPLAVADHVPGPEVIGKDSKAKKDSSSRQSRGRDKNRVEAAADEKVTRSVLQQDVVAKAEPDECYDGIGEPYPPGPPCADGQEKVSGAYAWGMTTYRKKIWIGDAHNVGCWGGANYNGTTEPHDNGRSVCEFGESSYEDKPLLDALGDWRPPQIFRYHTGTDSFRDKSEPAQDLLDTTLGLRSAGQHKRVVFLAGPARNLLSIKIFAFRGDTEEYLGGATLTDYSDIRRWIVVDGELYAGVARRGGGGAVLRWTGSASRPFRFEEVGDFDTEVAELGEHDGRLFAGTWPNNLGIGGDAQAGLYMSPSVPDGGLTEDDANDWTRVWRPSDYEPDRVNAGTYGLGPMKSFDGYLFWGTMNVPGAAALAHFDEYGDPATPEEEQEVRQKTFRATSFYRGRNFTGSPDIDLLYGETSLPVYTSGSGWSNEPTKMGDPLHGPSGFGNPVNAYTWSMAKFNGSLYVGTFDLTTFFEVPGVTRGADLYRFSSADDPVQAENLDGLGNWTNHGVRNLVVVGDTLYAGTANIQNLMTDPNDGEPEGGWELVKLTE